MKVVRYIIESAIVILWVCVATAFFLVAYLLPDLHKKNG